MSQNLLPRRERITLRHEAPEVIEDWPVTIRLRKALQPSGEKAEVGIKAPSLARGLAADAVKSFFQSVRSLGADGEAGGTGLDAGFAIQGLQLRVWAMKHQNADILAQPRGDIDRQGIQPCGRSTMGRPKETIRQVTRKSPSLRPRIGDRATNDAPFCHPARKIMRAARIVWQWQRVEQNAMERTDIEWINLPFCATAGSAMIHNIRLCAEWV